MKITIDKAVNDFLKKRELIKSGVKMTLNTGFNNLNQITANGLMKNTVNVIAAHSGVGKTALSLMLAHNFLAVNEKLKILFFTLEMPSEAIIARFVSRFEEKTVLQLNTEQDIDISDKTLNIIKNLDITFYEYAGTVTSIYSKISEFARDNPEDHCLIMIDHSLLIDGDGENQKITDLANTLNSCKKDFKNTTYLILSQLNDAMYNPSRLTSSKNVYPIYTDLYYGRALFQISDAVLVMVKPKDLYDGDTSLLYGPRKLIQQTEQKVGNNIVKRDIIYIFVLKGRDSGKGSVACFIDNLKHNKLIPISYQECTKTEKF